MKEIKEELEKRYSERRAQKNSSPISMLIKIVLLVLVISLIRFFGTGKDSKFRNIFDSFSHKSQKEKLK